jgi:hypothetical protein
MAICVCWGAYCTPGLPFPRHCCGLYGAAIGELATDEGAYGEDELFANGENGLKEVALAGVCRLPWACAKAVPCVMMPGRTAAARPGEMGCPYGDAFAGGGGTPG